MSGFSGISLLVCALLCTAPPLRARAQNTAPGPPADSNALPPPKGQVIIQSHGEPPGSPEQGASSGTAANAQEPVVDQQGNVDITDANRSALLITGYDLDARLAPATSGLSVRAQVTVRNDGPTALKELALQISSTLHWDSATLVEGASRTHLVLAQHKLETDADHTGAETEAILALPAALAAGSATTLDLFYSGTVPESGGRLARLGADAAQQRSTDWDAISSDWTGLRGFGNVLWYPVASPQVFLADGNALFEAVGRTRLREENASVRLRVSVEYRGEAPAAAYFCGRRESLKAVSDDPDAAVANGTGVATAEFGSEPLGFRTPSLFVLQQPETVLSAVEAAADQASGSYSSSSRPAATNPGYSSSRSTPGQPTQAAGAGDPAGSGSFLAVESTDSGATQGFVAAADRVAPLLREWLGPQPLSALTAIDHGGQPFQDGPLLVGPLAVLEASPQSGALVQSLTHAWVQTGQPWMDEGLAQFFALLWTERQAGHDAAVAELGELVRPVSLSEPDPSAADHASAGEPLIAATDDVYYRRKAAAVWWMLRGIVGDGNLHAALEAWRVQPVSHDSAEAQAIAFQHLLEKLSGQQLGWFFSDWVLHDRGLPDLSIQDVGLAQEPAGTGHPAGWLVAVTVRNEGGAAAEVPLIVQSGARSTLRQLRIAGQTTVTERVLVETPPTSVTVNDGSTPELRSSTHTRQVNLETR